MIYEVTAHCAGCGTEIDAEINSDGSVEADGCYVSAVTAPVENIRDHATIVEDYVDLDTDPGNQTVVWVECENCCTVCNGQRP